MSTTGTAALTNEIKPVYDAQYYLAGQNMVYHDQFCDLKKAENGARGSTHNWPIVESLRPSTGVLDELQDVSTQQMSANEIILTLQEYGGALEITKLSAALSYADVAKQAAQVNGYQLAESIDLIVRAVMGQGTRQIFQGGRTARSGFQGQQTAGDRINAQFLELLGMITRSIKMPLWPDNSVATVLHPFVLYDLLQDPAIRAMAQYQYPELLFNGEIGYWGGVRLISSGNAKAFYGAGGNAASTLDTTTAASLAAGASTAYLTSVTNLLVGQWASIQDAAETGNTWSDTNELIRVTRVGTSGAGGTGIDFWALDPGPGDSGGCRYPHASGATFTNDNSVYPVTLLGPNSVSKAYSTFTGPFGETVVSGPFDRLGRFLTFGWYLIAAWGRTRNGWLMRGEVGSSQS